MTIRNALGVAACVLACVAIAGCSGSANDAPQTYQITMTEFGCAHHATQDRIAQLDAEGDQQAALAYIRQNLGTGECIEFSKGSVVYVDDMEALNGLDKVHAQGNPDDYWIVASVVTPAASNTVAATWLPAVGHLFDGVEVYKGKNHQDMGLIAGGTHPLMIPHADGSPGVTVHPILVVYKSDSSRHWMDTKEFSGWFVRSDDPRIHSGKLTMLDTNAAAREAVFGTQPVIHHINELAVGCQSLRTFTALAKIAAARNIKKFRATADADIDSGDCEAFRPGDAVVVDTSASVPDAAHVHRPNESVTYWTIAKAVGP